VVESADMRYMSAIALLGILSGTRALLLVPPLIAGDDVPGKPVPPNSDEGRRLMRAGKLDEAVVQLEAAWKSTEAPEVLFELALCYERLNRDSEAIEAYRAYQKLPLALRGEEAEQHIRTIESKQPQAAWPGGRPRRVRVPLTQAGEKCIRDCARLSSCSKSQWQRCSLTRFVCFRGCPGARVDSGSCAGKQDPKMKCVTEGDYAGLQ
jgi:hypothetical protein